MDKISKFQRSKNMSFIKSKNTKPEILIRSLLFSKGYRFKIHDKKLPGKPDIVMPKLKTVVNIHGCYWHYHGCSRSNVPKTKTKYWLEKLENNKRRDSQNKRKLTKLGWRVIDVWECTLKRRNIDKTFDKLQRMIAC
jgi:DNA mismatch endonuclease (patch repair protein)|tara:strand:- start:124 stop:534 length:411 start_codon:yes stop_codon:yes gene_type:complete